MTITTHSDTYATYTSGTETVWVMYEGEQYGSGGGHYSTWLYERSTTRPNGRQKVRRGRLESPFADPDLTAGEVLQGYLESLREARIRTQQQAGWTDSQRAAWAAVEGDQWG